MQLARCDELRELGQQCQLSSCLVLMCREELARLAAVHPADEIAEAAARAAAAAAEQQATAAALAERDHAAIAAAAECEWVDVLCWALCMPKCREHQMYHVPVACWCLLQLRGSSKVKQIKGEWEDHLESSMHSLVRTSASSVSNSAFLHPPILSAAPNGFMCSCANWRPCACNASCS
jgi:hypothetical protein